MVNGTITTPSGVGILLRGRSRESLNSLKSHDPSSCPERNRARERKSGRWRKRETKRRSFLTLQVDYKSTGHFGHTFGQYHPSDTF